MSEMDEFEERPTMDSPQQVQPVDSIPSDQSQRVNDEPEEDDIEEQHADSEVGNAVGDNDQVEEAVAEELGEDEEEEEAEDEVEVNYDGEELEIGFNVSYLMEALANVPSDTVSIFLTDSSSSCLIVPEGRDDCQYVVMPMRL